MRFLRYQLILTILLILVGSVNINTGLTLAYTATIDQLKQGSTNQLLRVSFEPSSGLNAVNVYLYTSESDPSIQEKNYNNNSYVIDLNNTMVATTNNINLQKVADIISNVKITPFINTSNPESSGMTRIVIDTKIPDVKFNLIVKPVKVNKNNTANVTAKIYYPKSDQPTEPQNMAFFTPLDEKTTSKIPKEKILEDIRPDDYSYISQLPVNEDSKLKVSPPIEAITPGSNLTNTQNLPEMPSSITPPNTEDGANQEGQSPQPPPQNTGSIQTVWPKDLSKTVGLILGPIIAFLILILLIIVKKLKKKPKMQKHQGSDPYINAGDQPNIEGLEPIKDINLEEPSKNGNGYSPFNSDVDEVHVIDSAEIDDKKALYLIKFEENLSLIGAVDDDVTVLNNFAPHELIESPEIPLNISVSKEGVIVGKEIYLIKISNWQGVVTAEDDVLSFHSNLTV